MWRWLAIALGMLAFVASPVEARSPSAKKGIWGPVSVDGRSQFPIYRELGVGVYNTRLRWSSTAPTRPARARDPRDAAYQWPAELDEAIRQARHSNMRVAVEVAGTPSWANGGKAANWAPRRPVAYARFLAAAARRYPGVRYWVIWGEPVRQPNFMPIARVPPWRGLTRQEARGPERYALLLDRAYGAIKAVNPRALVVGGNSFTSGDIGPRNWIGNLRLPSGRAPRMDLYGHNPFAAREPNLSKDLIREGMADFCDLDALARWIDRDLGRTPRGTRIKLFLGEYLIPTDHANFEFRWWVSRRTQARWISSALRITRRWDRIETLGYLGLYDPQPTPQGKQMDAGLIDSAGRRKPGFYAFKRG